jgi:Domain of unknown function (DUF1902)
MPQIVLARRHRLKAWLRQLQKNCFDARAVWDDEAKLWVAESDDVPGLAAELKTRTS